MQQATETAKLATDGVLFRCFRFEIVDFIPNPFRVAERPFQATFRRFVPLYRNRRPMIVCKQGNLPEATAAHS